MSFIKKHRAKIIAGACIVAVLAIAFFFGGSKSTDTNNSGTDKPALVNSTAEPSEKSEAAKQPATSAEEAQGSASAPEAAESTRTPQESHTEKIGAAPGYLESNTMGTDEKTGTDKDNTESVPDGNSVPVEPEEAEITNNELTCTLSVRCENAVGKSSKKESVIPDNGIIFAEQEVVFYEGESVFNVLVREMKKNKIHLEFVNTPIYNSAYIECIGNLYEFDCGELSGWMYKVNDLFPNYGCSRYELQQGDKIEWVYTCDLGKDVGGEYSARNGMTNE